MSCYTWNLDKTNFESSKLSQRKTKTFEFSLHSPHTHWLTHSILSFSFMEINVRRFSKAFIAVCCFYISVSILVSVSAQGTTTIYV